MLLSNNKFDVYINIYVHYPEVYNSMVINRRLNIYFSNYFSNYPLINSKFSGNTYVMINSAPHDEKQLMKIDIAFSDRIDESLNNQETLSEWEEYLSVYFDRQISEFRFNFIN